MKVIYIIDSLQGSGAERSLVDIALNLTEFEPVFVHIYNGNMLGQQLEAEGIKVYSLNINPKPGYKEAVKKLIPIYKKEKPDIIHATLYNSDRIARKLKSYFPNIPLVGSFVNNSYTPLRYENQSLWMKIKLYRAFMLDKISARKVDFFISNSETIKKSEGSALGIPGNKIEVIHRGRRPDNFQNPNIERIEKIKEELNLKNKNVLLNVSRLIERKAQFDIIKSLPEVLKEYPNTILILAGHGNCETYLKNLVQNLNLNNSVHFLGRSTDVPELLHLAHVFVYPSYAEGLPGALIEAMMAEKLIIASNIGENLECVNEKSALIFEKGNIPQLTKKIIYSLENKSGLKALKQAAKGQALEKFNVEIISQKYETCYKHVILNFANNA